nr:MAG TPA: hypothetical protein [Bacteriophage sp.]
MVPLMIFPSLWLPSICFFTILIYAEYYIKMHVL